MCRYVKLTKNWRSSPAIISFPNRIFYDGELEACAPPSVANLCVGWKGLPNPDYPVIFHAVKGNSTFAQSLHFPALIASLGRDLRELSSPSWFNIEEASAAWYYVRDLRCDPSVGLGMRRLPHVLGLEI